MKWIHNENFHYIQIPHTCNKYVESFLFSHLLMAKKGSYDDGCFWFNFAGFFVELNLLTNWSISHCWWKKKIFSNQNIGLRQISNLYILIFRSKSFFVFLYWRWPYPYMMGTININISKVFILTKTKWTTSFFSCW